MFAPRRVRVEQAVPRDLSRTRRGFVRLTEEVAKFNLPVLDGNYLQRIGRIGLDPGQHSSVAGGACRPGQTSVSPNGQIAISTKGFSYASGASSLARVLAQKPPRLARLEANILKPDSWSSAVGLSKYYATWGAALHRAVRFYASLKVLRAKFGASVGRRREADRVAEKILQAGRSLGQRAGGTEPIVFAGKPARRASKGAAGGYASAILQALARRTTVFLVSEEFTSQRSVCVVHFVARGLA